MKLYELSEAFRTLSDLVEEGEDFSEALSQIQEELEAKVIGVAYVIKELTASKEAIQSEVDRLAKKMSSVDSSIARLKTYLVTEMQVADVQAVKQPIMTVRLQKSPASCSIVDVSKIPSNFRTSTLKIPTNNLPESMLEFVTDEVVDKKKIIELWKSGTDIAGTEVTQSMHVRIS